MSTVALFEAFMLIDKGKQREAEKDAEIARLQKELVYAEHTRCVYANDLRSQRDVIAEKNEQLATYAKSLREARDTVAEREADIEAYMDGLIAANKELDYARRQRESYKQALLDAAAVSPPRTLYVEVASPKQQETIEALKAELAACRRAKGEAAAIRDTLIAERNSLQARVRVLEQEKANLLSAYGNRRVAFRDTVAKLMSLADKPLGGTLDATTS